MSTLRPALVLFVLLTLITGVVYPLLITGVAQSLFPQQASGSLIVRDGKSVGSELIGQEFSAGRYFWGRLSATSPVPYTAFNAEKLTGSSGSNLAPTNPALVTNVESRIAALNAGDAAVQYARPASQLIPVDLVTSSGSGLDPHISLAAAEYQVPRVARARGVDESVLRALVQEHVQPRQLSVLGEPAVNVLQLNLALDGARE